MNETTLLGLCVIIFGISIIVFMVIYFTIKKLKQALPKAKEEKQFKKDKDKDKDYGIHLIQKDSLLDKDLYLKENLSVLLSEMGSNESTIVCLDNCIYLDGLVGKSININDYFIGWTGMYRLLYIGSKKNYTVLDLLMDNNFIKPGDNILIKYGNEWYLRRLKNILLKTNNIEVYEVDKVTKNSEFFNSSTEIKKVLFTGSYITKRVSSMSNNICFNFKNKVHFSWQ